MVTEAFVLVADGDGGVVGWKIPGTMGNFEKKGNGYCRNCCMWGNCARGAAVFWSAVDWGGSTDSRNNGYWGNCGYCGMKGNAGCWVAGASLFSVLAAPEGSLGPCGNCATVLVVDPGVCAIGLGPGNIGCLGNTGNCGYWGYCQTWPPSRGGTVVVVVGLISGNAGHVTESSTSTNIRKSKYSSSYKEIE